MYKSSHYKTNQDFLYQNQLPRSNLIDQSYDTPYQKEEPQPSDIKLDMKWETLQYANSGDPQVWGPSFWFILHNGAARYPEKASPIWKERMRGFILGMPVMIPCEKCADHATAHIEANWHRLDEVVSGRKNLFNFFVDMHNMVNKRYGKPIMGYEEAYELYTGRTNVTKMSYEDTCKNKDK